MPQVVITICTSACAIAVATVSAVLWWSSGTATAPAVTMPKYAVIQSGLFAAHSATRSPRRDAARAQAVRDVCDALAERCVRELVDALRVERDDRRAFAARRERRDELVQGCERGVAAIGHGRARGVGANGAARAGGAGSGGRASD